MSPHLVLLVNPTARNGGALRLMEPVVRRLRSRGAEVSVIVGDDASDALDRACTAVAERPDALVAFGGDGLVHLALQAVAGTDVPLGIIPVGTGNDIASAFGLPYKDPLAAADVVLAGRPRLVDAARITPATAAAAALWTSPSPGSPPDGPRVSSPAGFPTDGSPSVDPMTSGSQPVDPVTDGSQAVDHVTGGSQPGALAAGGSPTVSPATGGPPAATGGNPVESLGAGRRAEGSPVVGGPGAAGPLGAAGSEVAVAPDASVPSSPVPSSPVPTSAEVGEWFAGVVCCGFDSRVNERANRLTWPRGMAKYLMATAQELRSFRPIPFRIILDEQEVLELDAMLVAVGNTGSYGAGMKVCPGAVFDDGLLDVTIPGAVGKGDFVRTFPRVFKGTHITHPAVLTRRARTVRLEAADVVAYADGERVGAIPVTCEAVPAALSVLTL